jgi:hypothetical protein
MPHPQGEIKVQYKKKNSTLKAEIELPTQVSGSFIWNGKSYDLKGGKNVIETK